MNIFEIMFLIQYKTCIFFYILIFDGIHNCPGVFILLSSINILPTYYDWKLFLLIYHIYLCFIGLGLAYVGTKRQDAITLLLPVLTDSRSTPEVVAMAALACALITLGSPHPDVIQAILQTLLELHVSEITDGHYIKFLSLALGLCYLGKY